MSEKTVFPAGKGIVVRLKCIPSKTREKPKFRGKGTKIVCDLPFAVDDRNYLQYFDQTIFLTLTDRIRASSGEYKSTDSYRFIEEAMKPTIQSDNPDQKAALLAEKMAPYDGNHLSQLPADLAAPLLKHYVVYMKEPKPGQDGKIYQDTKEICTLEKVEWELDRRRVPDEEVLKQRQAAAAEARKNLGLPIPKGQQSAGPAKAESEQASGLQPGLPQTPPGEDKPHHGQVETARKFGTRVELVEELKAFVKASPDHATLKGKFLTHKGAELVQNLDDEAVKHLLVLFWLQAHRMNGGVVAANINAECMRRHKELHQFDPAEAFFLLVACDREAAEPDPF